MTATLTLDLIGTGAGAFSIFQNSDNYASAVATNVSSSSLLSGYSLTLDNATTTVRVYSTGTCTNYKDISVNLGDTTPTFTYRGIQSLDTSTAPRDTNIATDGKETVVVSSGPGAGGKTIISSNSGTSWTDITNNLSNSYYGTIIMFNPADGGGGAFYYAASDATINKHYLNNLGTFSTHTTDIALPGTDYVCGYFYHNNAYYIATNTELLRSTNNTNFTSVFTHTYGVNSKFLLDHLKGYGNTVYFSTGREIAKSTDNGLNWTSLVSSNSTGNPIDNVYVENANKVIYRDDTSNAYKYSTNGGTSFSSSGFVPAGGPSSEASTLIKYGPTYLHTAEYGTNYDRPAWTTTDPFSATSPTNNYIGTTQLNNPGSTSQYRTNVYNMKVLGKRLFLSGYLNTSSTGGTNVVYYDINSN